MAPDKRFTWWWPSSNAGNAAFWVVIAISSLTIFIFGPFAIINVVFWYSCAVAIRFVFIKAMGLEPRPTPPPAPSPQPDPATEPA